MPDAHHASSELGEGMPIHLQPDVEADIVDPGNFYISLGDVILTLEERGSWLRHEWGWSPKSCFVLHDEELEAVDFEEVDFLVEKMTRAGDGIDSKADSDFGEDTDSDSDGSGGSDGDIHSGAKLTFSLRHHTLWKIVMGKPVRLKEISMSCSGERHVIHTSEAADVRTIHELVPNQQHQLRKLQLLARSAGLGLGSGSDDPFLPVPARTCGVKVRQNHWHVLTISADLPFSMVFLARWGAYLGDRARLSGLGGQRTLLVGDQIWPIYLWDERPLFQVPEEMDARRADQRAPHCPGQSPFKDGGFARVSAQGCLALQVLRM